MNEQGNANVRLRQAARSGAVAALSQALEDGAHAWALDSLALQWAASDGHVECVRLLIPVSEPKAAYSAALSWAAQEGHVECVELLIPVSEPTALGSRALRLAAEGGHAGCLSLLMEASDPKAHNYQALRWAAHEGHADCVALLLPVSEPSAQGSDGMDAVGLARARGQAEVAGMIEAFIEAKELSGSIAGMEMRLKEKKAL